MADDEHLRVVRRGRRGARARRRGRSRWPSEPSTIGSMLSDSQASSAVSQRPHLRARVAGGELLVERRQRRAGRLGLAPPRGVSSRSSSGLESCGTASPCRSIQSWRAIARSMLTRPRDARRAPRSASSCARGTESSAAWRPLLSAGESSTCQAAKGVRSPKRSVHRSSTASIRLPPNAPPRRTTTSSTSPPSKGYVSTTWPTGTPAPSMTSLAQHAISSPSLPHGQSIGAADFAAPGRDPERRRTLRVAADRRPRVGRAVGAVQRTR